MIKEQILTTLNKHPQQLFNYKQLAKRLNINDSPAKQAVSDILKELKKEGRIQGFTRVSSEQKPNPRIYNRHC